MSVEKELLAATGFKPKREYGDRQDYLAALARSVNELDEDDFDELSSEAANWFNEACNALNGKDTIPDFDGVIEDDEETEPEESESVEEVETSEGPSDEEVETSEPEEDDPKDSSGDVDEKTEEKPKAKKAAKPKGGKKEAKNPNPLKRRPGNKLDHDPIVDLKNIPPEKAIEFDRFGIAKGTKNSVAVGMLLKGCRMADISESIGGTYYNVLGRLVKDGHKLEKASNGVLKLTHKDDLTKKSKK